MLDKQALCNFVHPGCINKNTASILQTRINRTWFENMFINFGDGLSVANINSMPGGTSQRALGLCLLA